MVVKRFEVFLVSLDPTVGSEIQKTQSCLIISPYEMNRHINTVICDNPNQEARRGFAPPG